MKRVWPSATRWTRGAARWVATVLVLVRHAAPRPVRWVLDHPQRILTLAWMVGVLVVGTTRTASADIIVGPDLARGAPKTLYESYGFADYKLTVKPDAENSDWFGIEDTILQVVGFINNMILWCCLGLLSGGLTLLEWFLNLTLYQDSAPEIDAATRVLADEIFWPLIGATVAVGCFISYARWRGEGRGFLADFGWVVAAGALATGFAAGPSQLMDSVDGMRQDLSAGVMSGTAAYVDDRGSVTGFPTPEITGDPQIAGTRRLVDSVWDTFGATLWCYAEFRSLDVCEVAGYHALAGDEQWRQWMDTLGNGGAPPEFGEHVHWIRGQDITRTGYLLVLALITIPMGVILVRMAIAGLIVTVGFLLMLIIGLLFLAFWPIPGWLRSLGTRYWIYTLGLQIQGLFITVVISGSTTVSVIISSRADQYGIFVVAVLNLGIFAAAMRARAWLELLTTTGGAGAVGFAALLMVRSAARTAGQTAASVTGGAWNFARHGFHGPGRAGGHHSGPAGRTGMPGFKNAGNWRPARFPQPQAPLDERPPNITATATRLPRTAALPGGRLQLGAGPAAAASGGHRRPSTGTSATSPGASRATTPGATRSGASTGGASKAHRRPFGTRRGRQEATLRANINRAQEATGRSGRVWVHKVGEGIAPVDPTPKPVPRRGRNSRQP